MSRSAVLVLVALLVIAPARPSAAGQNGEPDPGTIGFTFDDGPHPRWTPVVLDVLDRLEIRATFFVLGAQVAVHPELATEIARRGHSIQLHGYGHRPFPEMSDVEISTDLLRTSDLVYSATGLRPTCVRPPYGATTPRVDAVIASLGLHRVIWDLNSVDYSVATSGEAYHQVLNKAEPGDDVLGHDTLGWIWRDILPGLVAGLSARGIGFDTVCAMVDPGLGIRWGGPPDATAVQ